MQVEFTSEQETRLAAMAGDGGMAASELVREAALCVLRERERFLAAVEEGIASAERGELLEPAVVWARMEELLRS